VTTPAELDIRLLTPQRWDDLVALFGDRGAYSGCWCMWWRLSGREFDANGNAGNREAFRELVSDDRRPGLLGYLDGSPVGWVSVAPRPQFPRLLRSPLLGPAAEAADDDAVWSINCFYVDRRHRGTGVATALLDAAVRHAAGGGARYVEAYPVDPDVQRRSNADSFTGVSAMFEAAGFREVERRKAARPIYRRDV
jgi:GNAT superfamily N-acetyltransferase